jgi:hypothetical protein
MSISSKKIRKKVITTGSQIGLLLAEDGPADRAITRGAVFTAKILNRGEKELKKAVREARTVADEFRAKIHAATAPGAKRK